MSRRRSLPLAALAVLFAGACGGSGGPGAPTPVATHPLTGVLFYDENGNGSLEVSEVVRLPEATVEVGGGSGQSATGTGEFTVAAPAGTHALTVRASTLPPFFEAAPVTVTVPAGGPVMVPVTLPIGPNVPNRYLTFGDSITLGYTATHGQGYQLHLRNLLVNYFGKAEMVVDGVDATRTPRGAARLGDSMRVRPAYTLIHYGTNDWNEAACKFEPPCYTIDNLRHMVRFVKGNQSVPVIATIIPANPSHLETQPQRNDWVAFQDARIREMAREEGAILADLEAAFKRAGDMSRLFTDHVHPNDAGYAVMAEEFFRAIRQRSDGASSLPALFRKP